VVGTCFFAHKLFVRDAGEYHPLLAAARRERLAAARTGFDMGIPFNELNRAFDLGFEPLPWGDKGYVPSAMQAADAENPKSEGRNPKGGVPPSRSLHHNLRTFAHALPSVHESPFRSNKGNWLPARVSRRLDRSVRALRKVWPLVHTS
jgi:hypothetical protein